MSFLKINMQKLLFMAGELHSRGYENLIVIPSMAPSGMHWRCQFECKNHFERVAPSNWIQDHFAVRDNEIELSIEALTDLFESEHQNFLSNCKAENKKYVEWYRDMLKQLEIVELPYAFSDYYRDKNFWMTTTGKRIKTFDFIKE